MRSFRHDGVLLEAFKKFLISERAFRFSLWQVIKTRALTYYDIFLGNFFPNWGRGQIFSATLFFGLLVIFRKKVFGGEKNILWLWLLTPLVGLLFYQGNFGYVWGYYFAGVIPVFILIFAALLVSLGSLRDLPAGRPACRAGRQGLGKAILLVFMICFLWINGQRLAVYYKTGIGITLRSQLWALDWIYQDAQGKDFNVDVYVPPMIPYAYDYLFKWYGKQKYNREPVEKRADLLYTPYEQNAQHPNLLQAWLERQDGIGTIERQDSYGDVTVQRRKRL